MASHWPSCRKSVCDKVFTYEKTAYKIHRQRDINHSPFLAFCDLYGLYRLSENQTILSFIIKQNGYPAHRRLCTIIHSHILAFLQIS
ncbi:MAG: hypothetical protein JWR02_1405 [Mucilaginibacter sp.]|nr:hypothetical protein [Mucilaginibacter sp.]